MTTYKGLLTGVALAALTATGAHAAEFQKESFQFRNLTAYGEEEGNTSLGTLYFFVQVLDWVQKVGNGGYEPTSAAFLYSELHEPAGGCTQAFGWFPIANPDIQQNLQSASVDLQGSLPQYDCNTGNPLDDPLSVSLSATWTGQGISYTDRTTIVHNSIGFHSTWRFRGFTRDAAFVPTSGYIGDISLPMPGPSNDGELSNAKEGSLSISHY